MQIALFEMHTNVYKGISMKMSQNADDDKV